MDRYLCVVCRGLEQVSNELRTVQKCGMTGLEITIEIEWLRKCTVELKVEENAE